jgi:hypothetical protein
MSVASSRAPTLSIAQQKGILNNTSYFLRTTPRIWGKVIGYTNVSDTEVRAIVVYPNQHRGWFRVDPYTMKVHDCGTPPPPPVRH